MSDTITASGTVRDLFAHRFTLETKDGVVLADLGPKGAALVTLKAGDAIAIAGERKPSEIKVHSVTRGETTTTIPQKEHDHPPADAALARAAAETAGLKPVGEPRRKPQHFEVLGRDRDGQHHELHVTLDGSIRKRKPVSSDDGKWTEALAAS